jgi:MoxR-like ATPase
VLESNVQPGQTDTPLAERVQQRDRRVTSDNNSLIQTLERNISSVLLGKPDPIRLAIVALLADGHLLIEDAPGVGKTLLAKAIAKSLDCRFTRLQFTPDMLPSDILGSSVYLANLGEFEFRKGPIFTNVLLADEINRTPPRTQSALLEAMNEGQVSVEGRTYALDPPFFVLATQNPHEYEGTYPLPENQLDRFTICTDIGYPDRAHEMEVLEAHRRGEMVVHLKPVLTIDQLKHLQTAAREVKVHPSINSYMLDIIGATRTHDELELGVSTRGAIVLFRAVQCWALLENRTFAIPDDVKRLAVPVLAHRIVCRGLVREGQRERARTVIRQILQKTPVPA